MGHAYILPPTDPPVLIKNVITPPAGWSGGSPSEDLTDFDSEALTDFDTQTLQA